jgi:hypothetical protein
MYLGKLAGRQVKLVEASQNDSGTSYLVISGNGKRRFLALQPGMMALMYALECMRVSYRPEALELSTKLQMQGTELLRASGEIFDFPDWKIGDYAALADDCRAAGQARPFADEDFRSYELWLVYSLGEAVFFSCPELWPELIAQHREMLNSIADDEHLECRLSNVTVAPADRYRVLTLHHPRISESV